LESSRKTNALVRGCEGWKNAGFWREFALLKASLTNNAASSAQHFFFVVTARSVTRLGNVVACLGILENSVNSVFNSEALMPPLLIEFRDNGTGHEDLHIWLEGYSCTADSYYLAIDPSIQPKEASINKVRRVLISLLEHWLGALRRASPAHPVYLPFDFSDQYTGCFFCKPDGEFFEVVPGTSSREGWNVGPGNPEDYFFSISDFRPDSPEGFRFTSLEFFGRILESIADARIKLQRSQASAMPMETTVASIYHPHDDLHDLCVKEGEREMRVLSEMKDGRIEFHYYHIAKWEYPFHEDPLTEEDRSRLATQIFNHYTAEGWRVEIDRRRSCPKCGEQLNGSQFPDWPGGTCEFCGKEIDSSGNVLIGDTQ
jgi:hypothetical protein